MYSKIQVNTANVIDVVKSDDYNIPNPSQLVFAGTTSTNTVIKDITACANIFTSITTAAGGGNLLVDSIPITGTPPRGLDFTKNSNISAAQSATSLAQNLFAIQVGNQVQETTTNATGHVVSIDSSSQLTLDSIIANTVGDDYILRQNGFINRLGVKVGYVVLNTTDFTMNFVTEVTNDAQLSVGGTIMSTNDTYEIYAQNDVDLKVVNANEGALIYVGSNAAIVQDIQPSAPVAPGVGTADPRYVDIKVTTAGNQVRIFKNFPVGEYLPVQCIKIWNTGTDAAVRPLAIF
tara:strand:- start:2137 stop:3009 length:873 start_codon:yes stop_codon:yes gene_type:complete